MSDVNTEWKELRQKIGNFICHMDSTNAQIDSKLKTLQEKEEEETDWQSQIDKVYYKGIQDMYEALHIIASEDGMSTSDLKDAFGICSVCNIILGFTPEEIFDKTLEWKTKQKKEEQELHVGDEIEYARSKSRFEKRIIIGIEDGMSDGEKIIWSIDVELTGHRFWFYSTDKDVEYRKTGKHYDAIPFPKEIK